MPQKPFNEQSLIELKKNKARIQGLAIVGVVVWLMLVGLLFYKLFFTSKSTASFLPFVIIIPITFISVFKNLSAINAEMKDRS